MHCQKGWKTFTSRYFSRHHCARVFEEHGTSSKDNDLEWNEIDSEQRESNRFMNIDINNKNQN